MSSEKFETVVHRYCEPEEGIGEEIVREAGVLFSKLRGIKGPSKVKTLNALRVMLHGHSPFQDEPVDCVLWVPSKIVVANDYNPNVVAPPEMKLLETSIMEDGYTQPIVSWPNCDEVEVVDGFHRNRVGRESSVVRRRVHGCLPITMINVSRGERNNRIASTIRHNRARGKHTVEGMSDIVLELKRRNWTNERVARELGMEQDEILRLCQITGLSDLFSDQEFSKSWDVEGEAVASDFTELTDDISTYGDEAQAFRTVNTSDEGRIFHVHDKWECFKAGFYKSSVDGKSREQCEAAYRDFLADTDGFAEALKHVVTEWKHSCEHYLTNKAMNRIAWLGQAAMCYATGVPSEFRGGYSLLTGEQQEDADWTALKYLNRWLKRNGLAKVGMSEAKSQDRQSDIY